MNRFEKIWIPIYLKPYNLGTNISKQAVFFLKLINLIQLQLRIIPNPRMALISKKKKKKRINTPTTNSYSEIRLADSPKYPKLCIGGTYFKRSPEPIYRPHLGVNGISQAVGSTCLIFQCSFGPSIPNLIKL